MKGGGFLLAAAVASLWALLYLVTQVAADPPLSPDWLVLAGASLSALMIVGYPSALRGPRSARTARRAPWRRGGWRAARAGQAGTMAVFGQPMPLRSGLTSEAAERTARLLRRLLDSDAVAITDCERVLSFVGPGRDHHRPGRHYATAATEKVLAESRSLVLRNREEVGCAHPKCPLESATIAPLVVGERAVGALKVYRLAPDPPPRELIEGIAGILSLHLELSELDRERQLAADAKLEALRAQINPHFLFNTLNTITSKARTDPEETRRLLLRLSDFFRYSVRQHGQFAEFGEEYFFCRTYLSLEQARYGDRLSVRYDVDPQVLGARVPVLTIQPLIENAVKHGLAEQVGGGRVTLRARVDPLTRTTTIRVSDDGVGMDTETLQKVLSGEQPGGGIGLRNINDRLASLFGERYGLEVRSRPGEGTVVELRMPLR